MNNQNIAKSDTQRKKILLVDDEEEALVQLTNLLKRANFEVVSTSKGKEALALASNTKPDLIILDMLLPDMPGAEISRKLSADPALSAIPVLFLTGLNTKEDEIIMKEKAGVYHLLAKPITREELLEAIHKIIPSA
ncbi:MAG: response regulator [Candidatus Omnitrophica bacterium]|nr:response regulator [Candidatus Omnitrophota bacterium]